MNGSPLFVPAWAERELAKKDAFDTVRFQTLEAFYKAWEEFHAISSDKINRKKKEEAAQRMVDQAHILRRMYAERIQ